MKYTIAKNANANHKVTHGKYSVQ